jgi:hypothetical protein
MMTIKKLRIFIFTIILVLPMLIHGAGVIIVKVKGNVQVRKGLEEKWQPAKNGMILEDIDTILNISGEVILQLNQDITFSLGPNAMLDIADLRNISKRDLFLLLMSKKVKKIEPSGGQKNIKVSNVTVVHAESKLAQKQSPGTDNRQLFDRSLNGAKALFTQKYYTNTIVKLHQILSRFPGMDACGEIYYHLGKSFEQLSETGQAIDAYEETLKRSNANCSYSYKTKAEEAIKHLRSREE